MTLGDEQPFRGVFLVKRYSDKPKTIPRVSRADLEKQMAEFEARGGNIVEIPIGVCKSDEVTLTEAQKIATNVKTRI